jgi:predicted outer membrane protein
MNKRLIAAAPLALALVAVAAFAQQTETPTPKKQAEAKTVAPRPTFADGIKRHVQRVGASVDEAKTTSDMVVSNYLDPKGAKTTIVIVNEYVIRRKNLIGFYVYNFGNLKKAASREEIYKYLLSTNDAITIGSFFVDNDEDIGYKYLVSASQSLSQSAFDSAYLTMAAVAAERRAEIRQLLDSSTIKEETPPDAKKAAEEKPPQQN